MSVMEGTFLQDPDFGADYKCLKVVGKGGSSTVYKGVLTNTQHYVAIKQIDTDGLSKDQIMNIRQEIDTIKDLSHDHIVSYLGTRTIPSKIMIFLEYADRGSLRQFYQRRGKLTEPQAANCTRQILKGLSYLHDNGIAHRDVKCANCLLTKGGVIKLGDFGASKRFESDSVVSGLKGTPHWMAPEVIKGTQMTTGWIKSDVWSVGCTVVEMLTGTLPYAEYENPMTAMYHIANGQQPPLGTETENVSQDLILFINSCCDLNPELRPTAAQLYAMPYPSRQATVKRRIAGDSSKDTTPTTTPVKSKGKDSDDTGATMYTPQPAVGAAGDMSSQTPESTNKNNISPSVRNNDSNTSHTNSGDMYGIKEQTNSGTSEIMSSKNSTTTTEELCEKNIPSNSREKYYNGISSCSSNVISHSEGEFSLAQMIADAEKLKAEKSAKAAPASIPVKQVQDDRGHDNNSSYNHTSAYSSFMKDEIKHNNDSKYSIVDTNEHALSDTINTEFIVTNRIVTGKNRYDDSDEEYAEEYDDIDNDSELDLDEFDEGRGNSLCVVAGVDIRSSCHSKDSDSIGNRVEYVPKMSVNDPSNRRNRPQGPSDRLKNGMSSSNEHRDDSNINIRDSSGSNRASTTSIATLPAGSYTVDMGDTEGTTGTYTYGNGMEGGDMASYEDAANAVLEKVGLNRNSYNADAETPVMTHGIGFFTSSPTRSQEYHGHHVGGDMDSFEDSQLHPQPSAEVQLDRNVKHRVNHNSSSSYQQYNKDNKHVSNSKSAEYATNNGEEASSGGVYYNNLTQSPAGSIDATGRPVAAIPGNRMSGGSPGVSIEILEKASSSGGASIRKQALEELNTSHSSCHGIASPNRFVISSGENNTSSTSREWHNPSQQQQKQRVKKNSFRSKSANSAGPAPIAGSRLPPMASIQNSSMNPLAPLGSLGSDSNGIVDRPSNPLTGNGMAPMGIAHGLGSTSSSNGIPTNHLGGRNILGGGMSHPLGMPNSYMSRGIHSAPEVTRSNDNMALPPIGSMTPTSKGKSGNKGAGNHYFSASNEGLQSHSSKTLGALR